MKGVLNTSGMLASSRRVKLWWQARHWASHLLADAAILCVRVSKRAYDHTRPGGRPPPRKPRRKRLRMIRGGRAETPAAG